MNDKNWEHLNSVFKVIIEEIQLWVRVLFQVDGKSGRSRNGQVKPEIINLTFTNLRKEVGPKCDKKTGWQVCDNYHSHLFGQERSLKLKQYDGLIQEYLICFLLCH